MLAEKEYLLLSEYLNAKTLSNIDKTVNVHESLQDSSEFIKNSISKDMLEKLGLELIDSKTIGAVSTYIFKENCGDTCVVCASTEDLGGNSLSKEYQNQLVDFVRNNIATGKCVITGLKFGGIYACHLVPHLNAEGIVFCAPSTEELLGNITNYVGENEPVGKFTEKVVFIKQKLVEYNGYKYYSDTLEFDENGKPIIGNQSEYSKFCSWFYSIERDIDEQVWKIFFNESNDENWLENDLYSIFLKVDELNFEGIKNSTINAIKYIENELYKNMKSMELRFDKKIFNLDRIAFEEGICKFAEKESFNSVKLVKGIYNSVETILTGIRVFALEKNLFVDDLMQEFYINVESILEKEGQRIIDFLDKERQNYLDSLSVFPKLSFE
ncbi:hypothetical protein EHE19_004960 [Ruminiclostridium herbifermentans]|uniref:Uncharacterized protein n=1 Tax=Ruminiclostridium herbifermentans TaxID=2488810 RepID=A0A4U7JCT6_9FIRM|nr:hypothetical protein [Ruminiclostridium herbifermentans]QNU67813.1 hypothetical protein EHE19_004960 [Ruminiclostridium herbifermentans]